MYRTEGMWANEEDRLESVLLKKKRLAANVRNMATRQLADKETSHKLDKCYDVSLRYFVHLYQLTVDTRIESRCIFSRPY